MVFPRLIDMSGKKIGKLTFLEYKGKRKWLCKCDCGGSKTVLRYNVISGHTVSCGCRQKEVKNNVSFLNRSHLMSKSRFYRIWKAILRRCNNKKIPSFKYYGGRGIKVCESWHKFENFKKDMLSFYIAHVVGFGEKNTTIERKDNNEGYSPKNCKWATIKEQNNNQNKRKIFPEKEKNGKWKKPDSTEPKPSDDEDDAIFDEGKANGGHYDYDLLSGKSRRMGTREWR